MKSYIIIHFIILLIPALVSVFLYHFVIRGQSGIGFIYLTVMATFFLCIISGIVGTKYSNSIWVPAAINCGVVLITMLLSGQPSVIAWVFPVFIVTFLYSFFTWLIIKSSPGTFSHTAYVILLVIIILLGIYIFFAYVNGPVHRGDSSFFFATNETSVDCEQIFPSRELYEDYVQYAKTKGIEEKFSSIYSSTLLVDNENGIPYSGKLILYKPKLKINPLPRKKEVLLYYMDGFLWGYSYGETHLPTYYTNTALLYLPGMPASLPYLVYNKYDQEALKILQSVGDYYVLPDERLLALGEDKMLYLGNYHHHYNGLLNYIYWNKLEIGPDWYWHHFENRHFDTLGYSEERSTWNPDDFIPVDNIPDVIEPGAIKDPEKIRFMEENFVHPTRIWLPENTFSWNDKETLLFNLCGLHGFSEKKEYPVNILITNGREKSVHQMEPEDAKHTGYIFNQCIIEPNLDSPHMRNVRYSNSVVYFVIREEVSEKKFQLGYLNGRFIMENNFYTFIFPEDKEMEFTAQMLALISKYIEPESKES